MQVLVIMTVLWGLQTGVSYRVQLTLLLVASIFLYIVDMLPLSHSHMHTRTHTQLLKENLSLPLHPPVLLR